jgi:hypothetical protein
MSVYISQLPEYSGSAADSRWFIMNNSGETTTFKFSGYSTSITFGTGTDSIKSTNATDASGTNSIAIGKGAQAQGVDTVVIGNNASASSTPSDRTVAIGRHGSLGSGKLISIGSGAYISGDNSIAIGHETAASNGSIVLGGGSASRANGLHSITIGNNNEQNLGEKTIEIGYNNRNALPPTFQGSAFSVILGSEHRVETGAGYSYNNIIGGFGNYITGNTSGTTLIGLVNYTEPLLNDTVYLNNLQVLRTPSTQVQPISSGTTFTCNLDNGAKSQFYITGTSTVNITNVRDGASFMIKTQTDGNHNMTWTATGYTFVFTGGLKDPGNNVTDIFVFEVFGSVIYGNRRHNYS